MVVPLVILAVLSVIGGYVGVPGSLGGSNHFDKFLGPVFQASAPAGETAAVGEKRAPEQEGSGPKTEASNELLFTGISVLAGLLGFALAWQLYYQNPQLPEKIAHSMQGAYQAVLNKYYVDEFYAALFVRAIDRRVDANSLARRGPQNHRCGGE